MKYLTLHIEISFFFKKFQGLSVVGTHAEKLKTTSKPDIRLGQTLLRKNR